MNVGLPVFTIHGNHDDPGGADNLSAVDVLSTCSLVNYFGKLVGIASKGLHVRACFCICVDALHAWQLGVCMRAICSVRIYTFAAMTVCRILFAF